MPEHYNAPSIGALAVGCYLLMVACSAQAVDKI
jgi:hypothetical protein